MTPDDLAAAIAALGPGVPAGLAPIVLVGLALTVGVGAWRQVFR